MKWSQVVVRETTDPQVAARWFEQQQVSPVSADGARTRWTFQPVEETNE